MAATLEIRVIGSSDDAEESTLGAVDLTSTDLELIKDSTDQTVGMRFTGISIPKGTTITKAYMQFKVDETDSEATSLTIKGQAADNASTFSSTGSDISSRATTTASAAWSPSAWNTVGEAGTTQQTADLINRNK